MNIKFKVGDIQKWKGVRNSDTGLIDSGWLYIIEKIEDKTITARGHHIVGVSNRSQAIKKYKQYINDEMSY